MPATYALDFYLQRLQQESEARGYAFERCGDQIQITKRTSARLTTIYVLVKSGILQPVRAQTNTSYLYAHFNELVYQRWVLDVCSAGFTYIPYDKRAAPN